MRVRLIRKMARKLDGIDVSDRSIGESFDLSDAEAALLVAEGWAIVEPTNGFVPAAFAAQPKTPPQPDGHDLALARTLERLRELRAEIEQPRHVDYERRRAEDVIREELHDARAKTIRP